MSAFFKLCSNINAAIKRQQISVTTPNSIINESVLRLLYIEGFIRGFTKNSDLTGKKEVLTVHLAYNLRQPVLKQLIAVSKPGRKVYATKKSLQFLWNRTYTRNREIMLNRIRSARIVLSTNQGILTEFQALSLGIGGEVLCKIVA